MPGHATQVRLNRPQSVWRIMLVLCLLAALVLVGALASGSADLDWHWSWQAWRQFSHALWQADGSDMRATLFTLRATRALSAMVTGGALALAGVMMQALLRNPLSDPYVLGVSAGAAVGALLAMLLTGLAWVIDGAAFLGAVAVSLLLYALARRDLQHGSQRNALLLTGVMLGSACMAVVTLILALAPEGRLRGMVFWMMGDLSVTSWHPAPTLLLAVVAYLTCRSARALNVLAMHAGHALALGVRVPQLRRGLFIGAAILTASAVSHAGSIGFVGLVVPHACRFAFGPDHRVLVPASVVVGGSFLLLADTLARTVAAPLQLPVGVITSLVGVPFFLMQLHQIRQAR